MSYRIGVVQLPGSNCERETKLALARVGLHAVDLLWFADLEDLAACDGYVIVGGFSYEDRNRAGSIAAYDRVIQALMVQAKSGKPVIGICNGAQILVETGLVPGYLDDNGQFAPAIALTPNRRACQGKLAGSGYYNTWCRIGRQEQGAVTDSIEVPLAHAEGRFLLGDGVYQDLLSEGVALWQYVDDAGKVVETFPTNPNGSQYNLAAVGNFSGNVLAMMPHPERTPKGDLVFRQLKAYLETAASFSWRTKNISITRNLHSSYPSSCGLIPQAQDDEAMLHDNHTLRYFTKLIIADNEAISVELAFKKQNIDVSMTKYRYWGLNFNSKVGPTLEDKDNIAASYELWNPQKEIAIEQLPLKKQTTYVLITDNFDPEAAAKENILRQRCHVTTLKKVQSGIVWALHGKADEIEKALRSKLLLNPIAQKLTHLSVENACLA